jgi:hypothetical protein
MTSWKAYAIAILGEAIRLLAVNSRGTWPEAACALAGIAGTLIVAYACFSFAKSRDHSGYYSVLGIFGLLGFAIMAFIVGHGGKHLTTRSRPTPTAAALTPTLERLMSSSAMNEVKAFLMPIFEKFEPSTSEQVQELEALIGRALPSSYTSFLLRYGRCGFSSEAKVKARNGSELQVFTLFGIKDQPGGVMADLAAHPTYLQSGFIPIGDDLFNNRYVLHKGSGAVSFLSYSNGSVSEVGVAQSFAEFLERIEVTPEE